jgi:ribosome-binding protein aMBF1 (putative translation factor)
MTFSFVELAGHDPADPAVVAAGQDFEDFARLMQGLVARRKARGITQAQVAEAMATTQSVVSKLERIGANPTIQTLQSYARAVGDSLSLTITPVSQASSNKTASRVAKVSASSTSSHLGALVAIGPLPGSG